MESSDVNEGHYPSTLTLTCIVDMLLHILLLFAWAGGAQDKFYICFDLLQEMISMHDTLCIICLTQ